MFVPCQSHSSAYVSCASRFSTATLAKGGCAEAKVAEPMRHLVSTFMADFRFRGMGMPA
mgnify:CR=1 FL=1